ncbi:MAG: sterol desaturase family protein [Pseudomonadales bacterium]|nr:sterol desaturase family protein [Pseudomonadales bacterium]
MEIIETVVQEVLGFLRISAAWEIVTTGEIRAFASVDGIRALIFPIIPLLLIIELVLGLVRRNPQMRVYKVNFLIYVVNRFVGRFISLGIVVLCITLFQKHAPFQTTLTWYWFIYAYIVWEFGHFIYHFTTHKVRVLWCLHSTHHAPEEMNLSVNYAHFFLEAPYADLIRTSVCILMGVQVELLLIVMFIDGTYGAFIHVGENMIRDARFGFLKKLMLTPSHHRVHHARNPLYIDTNFCNLLNVWDRVFRTYQEEQTEVRVEYGISRKVDSGSFFDVYFGEFVFLAQDIFMAPRIRDKLLYVVMPPGWHHSGQHKTASTIRGGYIQKSEMQ